VEALAAPDRIVGLQTGDHVQKSFYLIFILLFVSSSAFGKEVSNVVVGIIEDDRTELANWKDGPSKNRVIRPLFEKKGNDWILSTNHSEKMHWAIAFDGRNFGEFESSPGKTTTGASLSKNVHVPLDKSNQDLVVGKASYSFSGWVYTDVNRPLVIVSNGNFSDPDRWKPFQPSDSQIRVFKSVFRSEYPTVENCDENEIPLPAPWSYDDSNIQIGNKSYQSNNGFILVGMHLNGCKCGIGSGPFLEQLFIFKANWTFTHIDLESNWNHADDTLSLTLVDAGDYDGDGQSEVVFFVSGYNEDGYALFYDSFRKNVVYTWVYH
jgi:hypothetical protein